MANNDIITITTTQSPDAKPVAASKNVTTVFSTLIEVPNFETPELVFGGQNVLSPGVAEIISPLMVSNYSANTAYFDARVYRLYDYSTEPETYISDTFYFVRNIPIPAYDTIPIPLNGQFFYNGDLLEIRSDQNDALTVNISYTLGQAEEFFISGG